MELQRNTRFGTCLVARKVGDAPRELEIRLCQQSQRVRVVPSLVGGAHYLFPSPDVTVAIQVYDQQDIARIETEQKSRSLTVLQKRILKPFKNLTEIETLFVDNNRNETNMLNILSPSKRKSPEIGTSNESCARDSGVTEDGDIFDHLSTFRDSFKYTAVFFVLNYDQLMEQLNRIGSFINQAQNTLASFIDSDQCSIDRNTKKQGCTRVLMVADNQSLLGSISSIIESLQPEKRALKEKFFRKEAAKTLLPESISRVPFSESKHLTKALRDWAIRAEIPMDDINVLKNILGSLEKIVTADEHILDSIPINLSSKIAILNFFKSSSTLEEEIKLRNDNNPSIYNEQRPQSKQNLSFRTPSQLTQCVISDNHCDRYHGDGGQISSYTDSTRQTSGSFSDRAKVSQAVHPNFQHQYTVQSMRSCHENRETGSANVFSARYQNYTTEASTYGN